MISNIVYGFLLLFFILLMFIVPLWICGSIMFNMFYHKETIFGRECNAIAYILYGVLIIPALTTIYHYLTRKPCTFPALIDFIGYYFKHGFGDSLILVLTCIILYAVMFLLSKMHSFAYKRIEKKQIKEAERSFEKINYDTLSSDLMEFVRANNLEKHDVEDVKAEVVMLPSTEQYEFSMNQSSDLKNICKEIILRSSIAEKGICYVLIKSEDLKNDLKQDASFNEFVNSEYFSVIELLEQLNLLMAEKINVSDKILELKKLKMLTNYLCT